MFVIMWFSHHIYQISTRKYFITSCYVKTNWRSSINIVINSWGVHCNFDMNYSEIINLRVVHQETFRTTSVIIYIINELHYASTPSHIYVNIPEKTSLKHNSIFFPLIIKQSPKLTNISQTSTKLQLRNISGCSYFSFVGLGSQLNDEALP